MCFRAVDIRANGLPGREQRSEREDLVQRDRGRPGVPSRHRQLRLGREAAERRRDGRCPAALEGGGVEPVGAGVSELRINYGPGYRVYFKKRGRELIILLAGGDKSTQAKDIKAALRYARDLSE